MTGDVPNTRWLFLSKIFLVIQILFSSIYVASQDTGVAFLGDYFLYGALALSPIVFFSLYKDMSIVRDRVEWPSGKLRYLGLMWMPVWNLLPAAVYYLNRKSLQRSGEIWISFRWFKEVITNPRHSLRWVYGGLGTFYTVFGLLFIFSLVITGLLPIDWIRTVSSQFVVFSTAGVLFMLVYVREEMRETLHIVLRDIGVRWLAIANCALTVLIIFWPLVVLVFLLLLPLLFINPDLSTGVALGILHPLFILPLAMALVLPLRLLPWVKAIPFIINDIKEQVVSVIKERLPFANDGRQANVESHSKVLPMSGFDHTDVTINSESNVTFSYTYGYQARDLEELKLDTVPCSMRWGILLLIPGYTLATIVWSSYWYQPEETLTLARSLPAEDILILALSSLGLPFTIAEAGLELVGLPTETLGLGFIGVMLPAVLMIPGAWHFALKSEIIIYDFLQNVQSSDQLGYRVLRRFDTSNHLTLLWLATLTFILPALVLWQGLNWGRQVVRRFNSP